MSLDPDIDRRNARLSATARARVLADRRRIVLVGARGWIGRTVLDLLHEALPPQELTARLACFGSAAGEIMLEDGTVVTQRPLAELADLPEMPSLVLHLAFLTKDKVAGMDAEAYAEKNRALSGEVRQALDVIGADRLFVASSGAAAFADDPEAAEDLRLYGTLKREDEERFAEWAEAAPGRRAAIGRIYSVSGPHINKPETYALASFILDALAGRPIAVRAPMRVWRSYVAVRELVSFVFAHLLADQVEPVLRFDTGGAALELAEVAGEVGRLLGAKVDRATITRTQDNRYVGDAESWRRLLAGQGMTPLAMADQVAETAAFLART